MYKSVKRFLNRNNRLKEENNLLKEENNLLKEELVELNSKVTWIYAVNKVNEKYVNPSSVKISK